MLEKPRFLVHLAPLYGSEAPNLGPFFYRDYSLVFTEISVYSGFPGSTGLVAIVYRNYIKKSEFCKVDRSIA